MDNRKEAILKAIITEYITGAEPVSSKSIMSHYDLQVSSATIRNEMAALEKLGYITQPHTSSGRMPVSLGYRYYVDYLLDELPLEAQGVLVKQIKSEISGTANYLEKIGSVISQLTNYTVFVTVERKQNKTIHHIKLVGLLEEQVLLVIMLSTNEVQNFLLPMLEKLRGNQLLHLSKVLNEYLKDKGIGELTAELKGEIRRILGEEQGLIETIFEHIEETLKKDESKDLVIEGVKNIFKLPEFDEVKKVAEFMSAIEEKDLVFNILDNALLEDSSSIAVKIGNEIGQSALDPYTLIATSYVLDDYTEGKIGIIGPTRMLYEQNINLLKAALEALKKDEK